jgi:hypothetical protein
MHGEKIRNYCIKNRPNTWKVTAHEYWTFFYIILVLRLDLLEVDALKKLSDVKLIFFPMMKIQETHLFAIDIGMYLCQTNM